MIERQALPVESLVLDAVQSREEAWTGDADDRQLADSIAADGVLQDIIVRPLDTVELADEQVSDADETYAIVAGSRRYHAAMEAGYERVPCKILNADDLDAAWTSLIENTDRKELSEQEIANQLKLIYELVRPREEPESCPACSADMAGESELLAHCAATTCTLPGSPSDGPSVRNSPDGSQVRRFSTDEQALEYVAKRFLGRDDESAISIVEGHLRTAELPPVLQSLFKSPEDRTEQERLALENYGIDVRATLGSGDGKSGTSREIVALYEAVDEEAETAAIDPTDAVLETVGSLRFDEMSEQELRRTLRDFRHDVTTQLESDVSTSDQREAFTETLQNCAAALKETYEEVEPTRPFKKVDVLGPETQHHSRWHTHAMQQRDVNGHGELVRELYQERLETLAETEEWE